MSIDSTAKQLIFNSQCFSSPFVHPSFPEFKIPPAWYSPFINAMLLPNYKNPGLRWTNYLLEIPHRWLDVTTSMCLLRYFAGLAYDAIFELVKDKADKSITDKEYLTYRNSIEDVIDEYFVQIAPLQEAYALYWAVTVLRQNTNPESKYLDHDYVTELSWDSIDDKTKYIYSDLVELSNHIGTTALSGIIGSLNMNWPQMFTHDSSDPEYAVKMRDYFIDYVRDSSNNPFFRFQEFVRLVNDTVKGKSISCVDSDEVGVYLYDNCPELRSYFIDPCSNSCVCKSIMDDILESNTEDYTKSPFYWVMSLSTSIRNDCHIEKETEASQDSQIALIRRKQPRSLPYFIFINDQCHVQPNVPDISALARLIMFESIRQQENQIIRKDRRQIIILKCPWENIEVFVDNEPSELDVFDSRSEWNRKVITDYWESVQRYEF